MHSPAVRTSDTERPTIPPALPSIVDLRYLTTISFPKPPSDGSPIRGTRCRRSESV
jgi:hypothetical protein